MPRPSRNTETRQKLLDQGLISFIHHGFHGTGLKEVLDAVQVPKGSFYNYFASKDDFVAQVVELYSERMLQAWDGVFADREGSRLDGIRNVFRLLGQVHENKQFTDGCLVGNLSAEVADTNDLLRETLAARFAEWQTRLADQLRLGQAQGEVRDDLPAEELAAFFWDAWQGALLRMKVERSLAPVRRALRFLLDDFLPAEPAVRASG